MIEYIGKFFKEVAFMVKIETHHGYIEISQEIFSNLVGHFA